jgi:hypothetical protein
MGVWEFGLGNELPFEFGMIDMFALFHRFDNAVTWRAIKNARLLPSMSCWYLMAITIGIQLRMTFPTCGQWRM